MSEPIITADIDKYLAVNKYSPSDETHIELVDDPDMAEFMKLVRVCPAALYKITESGEQRFDYSGCLECGTCRIICGDTIVEKWRNPDPECGVQYRYG